MTDVFQSPKMMARGESVSSRSGARHASHLFSAVDPDDRDPVVLDPLI
jgi:hypothetical protein